MRVLRRWLPSLAIFVVVQLAAAPTAVAETIAHTLGGPLNLVHHPERLWRTFPREIILVVVMGALAALPWVHAWRPHRAVLIVSLLGSVGWASAGFLFSVHHL